MHRPAHPPSPPSTPPAAPSSRPALAADPLDVLRAWGRKRPLACLISPPAGAVGRVPDARLSLVAEPNRRITLVRDPDGSLRWIDSNDAGGSARPTTDPIGDLGRMLPELAPPAPAPTTSATSLSPGWLIALSYDLAGLIEPRAGREHAASAPLIELQRIDDAWTHDAATGVWTPIGDPTPLPVESLDPIGFEAGTFVSEMGRGGYREAVRAGIEAIRAGDVFQVNLAHTLAAPFRGSARDAFCALAAQAKPAFGAYLELPGAEKHDLHRAVLSFSPELFLAIDPGGRTIRARPMKGTRPAPRQTEHADDAARELFEAEKDLAELNMIVDLMRNDLGRVAEIGSVRVDAPRQIERHPGVLQATAGVSATLRAGATIADVIRATHPPGSITGAPKIRAMQLINELERAERAFAFGAIGMLTDDGRLTLSVAIRTPTITGTPGGAPGTFAEATIRFPVGAGIVADSDPEAEWAETLAKATHLRAIAPVEESP